MKFAFQRPSQRYLVSISMSSSHDGSSTHRSLSLLWCRLSVADVPVDVGLVVHLLKDALGSLPGLLGNRRNVLPVCEPVTTSSNLLDGTLDKSALRDAGAEEDGVENEDDPAAYTRRKG